MEGLDDLTAVFLHQQGMLDVGVSCPDQAGLDDLLDDYVVGDVRIAILMIVVFQATRQ